MESSEEEDDFQTHEWITPQSSINSIYQSDTEKGIRKLCSELLDLKDAVENLSGNMQSKYVAFLRISEEVMEMEQELIELQKHVSAQGILVKDLMSGVCRELEVWNKCNIDEVDVNDDLQLSEIDELLHGEVDDKKVTFLETVDILLAERKVEEALLALDTEERSSPELNDLGEDPSPEISPYKSAFLKRKEMLADLLVGISQQPFVSIAELKKALSGLLKLGKASLAHQLLLKAYSYRLQKSIEDFLPSCSVYLETYTAKLSQLVFSTISVATKESNTLFGEGPPYTNRIIQWAEYEIETFVRLVKENAPPVESAAALRSASTCVQASFSHCSFLESQGLKFSKLLMVLLRPYMEEVLDMNFRRARRKVADLERNGDIVQLSPPPGSPSSLAALSDIMSTGSGKKFMSIVKDILEPLTPIVILHFGGTILSRLLQLFDKYVEKLIRALPSSSEDDNLTDPKETTELRAETDAQQLALIGTAFTVADELLPMAVAKIFNPQSENREEGSGPDCISPVAISSVEYKDWRRHLQHSLDKLRDYFCRQYVLTFIYSREDKARLDARMYLEGKGEDLFWDTDPLPSLPFQVVPFA
ncbi:exocyst complex component EXO84C-like [Asparagus officinalis]|uniref:exocyst complex component EXO84C-like n=1 Tax=Asparagus officinalis TaxID=4686 RepID=UPI00098DF32F|nr:exocyst complex component EXO84C-like [Asparagus officinalis]